MKDSILLKLDNLSARLEELNALLRNPNIQCIMSSIGGMNSNSLLPYIDYEALRQHPKLIIGYSDVTAILLALYAKTGIPVYYGPAMVASFGELPPFVDDTYHYFHDVVMDDHRPIDLQMPPYWSDEFIDWESQERSKKPYPNHWITVQGGRSCGRLIGGNLNTMMGIWGSEYMPPIHDGDILLIEDSLKDAATIERSFSHLKINGILDRVGGILLGKHELFKDQGTGRRPYDILMEVMGSRNIPILADVDCCHTHPMMTLPIGGHVLVDATAQTITLQADSMP